MSVGAQQRGTRLLAAYGMPAHMHGHKYGCESQPNVLFIHLQDCFAGMCAPLVAVVERRRHPALAKEVTLLGAASRCALPGLQQHLDACNERLLHAGGAAGVGCAPQLARRHRALPQG